MTMNRTNIVLSGLLATVAILTATTRVDYSQPNIEILPDMKYTPAWMAYAQNPVFANGRTLQAPVPGTIARGQMPLHFEATKEDAQRAAEELANPYHQSDSEPAKLQESIRRGGDTYRVFCISCHGPTGLGDGPVSQRGFPPPPSLLTGKSPQMKDGQLFHVLTYGQGSMSPFAAQISREIRWDVINYIRSLQQNAQATAVPVATSPDSKSNASSERESSKLSAPVQTPSDAQRDEAPAQSESKEKDSVH